MLSSVDCITTTSESEFLVHTTPIEFVELKNVLIPRRERRSTHLAGPYDALKEKVIDYG
jgi:hypothetical protein